MTFDTPARRKIDADDAEARQRLAGVGGAYKREHPRRSPEERKAVQRAYAARRKAEGWRFCIRCRHWTQGHTSRSCPERGK